MAAYVIFDVAIHDMAQYQEFMAGVKPAIEAAGGKCFVVNETEGMAALATWLGELEYGMGQTAA